MRLSVSGLKAGRMMTPSMCVLVCVMSETFPLIPLEASEVFYPCIENKRERVRAVRKLVKWLLNFWKVFMVKETKVRIGRVLSTVSFLGWP